MKQKRMENIDFSKIYSFSKLGRFEKCPLDYYFYYLDPKWKGYQKPKDYKTKGSAVHDAITLFYHLGSEERSFQNLKNCLYEAWFSENELARKPPLGEIGGFDSIVHERKTYRDALKLLKNFYELGDINPQFFYLPTKNIKRSFDDYEGLIKPVNDEFFISGKFDRIDRLEDGSLRIIDFKTGKSNQKRSQLDFYALLAELNFDHKVRVVSFYYLKKGKIVDFDLSDDGKESIRKQVIGKIEAIKNTKEFSPKTSRLCDYCDFKEICPIFH